MAEATSQQPFKVVIAGGSIAGLTLANALQKAGIDWVLIEKRDVVPNVGQTILVMPCTSLIFEQLGVSKFMDEVAIPLRDREHWDANMNLFCSSDELWRLYKKSGRPARFVDRYRFLKSLYDGIQDKSKIHTREGVVSYVETEHGVTVRTDKGNVFEGSILVGCDGVHSEVRQQIAAQIQKKDPKTAKVLTTGFKTNYCCLTSLSYNHFVDDEKRPFMRESLVANSYHTKEGIGGVSAVGTPGQLIWSAYIPLEKIDRSPVDEYPSPRFTQADIDLFMKRYGHLKVAPDYTFADAYASRVNNASMISMEENVLPVRWNNGGRVVILGDAVHKATANLGLGGNLCIDDVCGLVNGLVPLLKSSGSSEGPNTAELTRIFDDMEKKSRPRAQFVRRASTFFCGFETWTAWYAPIVKVIFPWIPSSIKMQVFSIFDAAAPKLDFLPVPEAKFQGDN